MPFQPTLRRPLAAGIAGFAIALAMTISLVAPALADTPPPLLGYKDDGQTSFVAPTTTGCSYGVDEFANTYYEQGWVPVPAGVHHVMVTAVGEAGMVGSNGGGAGGLGGEVSAIVPAYPGQIFYASPTSSVTQDPGGEHADNYYANGGHASFISTVSPTTEFATNLSGIANPEDLCNAEFDPPAYPEVMPQSDLVLVAGGGGGGGPNSGSSAGGNAGPDGIIGGGNYLGKSGAGGGGGGTQFGPGSGGSGATLDGYPGDYLAGGDAFGPGTTTGTAGGGGGGGFYGGGSGGTYIGVQRGGGGGGSNYVMPLPGDGTDRILSNGTSTQPSQVSIVPIYEPTVAITAPVNPSFAGTSTRITVTVSGLPSANQYRAGASGTVTLIENGVTVQQPFDPLVGTDAGVRTATFAQTSLTSGDVSYTATYNGDTSQESAEEFADIAEPETSPAFVESYKPVLTATVSGSMTYGDHTATFTASDSLPTGVTISGTAACTTANGGGALSSLSAGDYPIDPASCNGLTLGGVNATNYGLIYAGSVTVAPQTITAFILGSQPIGGPATFRDGISPTSSAPMVTGSPTCTTLADGTVIGPNLPRGVYLLGTCSGLTITPADAGNYALTISTIEFVSGTNTPTIAIPALDNPVVGSPFDTHVTIAGGGAPSGGVSLGFYDSDNCTGTLLDVGSASVSGNGDYDTGIVTPPHAGEFSMLANYSGDTFNTSVATGCEVVTVAKVGADVTFAIPASGLVGQPLSASATFASSIARTAGQVRFLLLPSSDTTCTGNTALVDDTQTVSADGVYTSTSFTPATAGTYRWTILYSGDDNHDVENAICQTTVVGGPPSVTSAAAATFTAGSNGSFVVTTTAGSPEATTLSASGALPDGITFTDNGDGSATLAGTPGAATGGSYPLTITAANLLTSATQSFVLTVAQSPDITSADTATFPAGESSSLTIKTAAGYPSSTALDVSGALPTGVTLVDNHDGTATLSGAPASSAGGSYPLTITASNGTAPDATQSFTLTVTQPIAIVGTAEAQFRVGQNGSYAVFTTAGYPTAATIILTGTLPAGLSFSDGGNGAGTLSGTPAVGSGGEYPVTITASNGAGTAVTQNLAITVDEPPAITSADTTTFTTGVSSTLTITTAGGYPRNASLTVSGALPAGTSFTDNHDGTATLSGVPSSATGGSYPLTITADNGTAPDASESFTLIVTQPVAIGGTAQAQFQVGQTENLAVVTTAGYPATTVLTLAGPLPAGLSFVDNGDGTGTLSGTPLTGSGAQYPVTITATNGIGTAAVEDLAITVDESPAITSADTATSTIGVTSSFTVTTGPGFPVVYSLTGSGALPPGLSMTISGGSATISGVATGPAADYPITLTASNGIAPDTVQTLTLSVTDAPAVPLPLTPPVGGGALDGVPAQSHPRESFTASATGFAPGAPITWGIYSSALTLASSFADSAGNASAQLTIPAGFAGLHTIVASGLAPNGSAYILSASTTVATPISLAQLPSTGEGVGTSPYTAMLLLGLGLVLVLAVSLRRKRRRS
jgi:predicted secreted protein